jgi:hypothetical protein
MLATMARKTAVQHVFGQDDPSGVVAAAEPSTCVSAPIETPL